MSSISSPNLTKTSGGSGNGIFTRVGNYELGRTLGEGTFAKVKFAKNIVTGESVAIKIIKKDKLLKHKMVEQVRVLETWSEISPFLFFLSVIFVSHSVIFLRYSMI